MKMRFGFVTNSSSTAYMIKNKTDETLTIVDFAKENPRILVDFLNTYDWYKYTQEQLIESAESRLIDDEKEYTFKPHENKYIVFGDEQGDVIGSVYDYELRDGGNSESFSWRYEESLR